jgi:selenocysteine-specific elongation factor
MLTCRLSLVSDSGWDLEQGQRVRVHLGTSEVLARVALFDRERLQAGEEGWAQLRLEEPVLARVKDHLVIRSYSPVTTMGGGRVAEIRPRKRRRLQAGEGEELGNRLSESPETALVSLLEMSGWAGASHESLPQRTGLSPGSLQRARERLQSEGRAVEVDNRLFSGRSWDEGRERLLAALSGYHHKHPLRTGMPLEELRQVLPGEFGPKLSEAILRTLAEGGRIRLERGTARLADFRPSLTGPQEAARRELRTILVDAGLAPPNVKELGETLGMEEEVPGILGLMEVDGEVVNVDGDFFFHREAVHRAGRDVIAAHSGAEKLGPADFREVLPVTRRHLLPLLRYFDLIGVTTRIGDERKVAEEMPRSWVTEDGSAEP